MMLDPRGVTVLGKVDEAEKQRVLEEADVLCAPSLGGESFGMVLTEAFAAGHAGGRLRHRRLPGRRARRRRRRAGAGGRRAGARGGAAGPLRRARPPGRRWRAPPAVDVERFAWPRVAAEVMNAYEDAIATRARDRRACAARRSGSAPEPRT